MARTRSQQQIPMQNVGFALCLAGATLGALGLLGWLTGLESLVTLIPGQPMMVPNTSVCLILLGIAGALRRECPARQMRLLIAVSAGVFVLTIGVGTLAEYGLNLQTALDQLIIRSHEEPYPGRMSPLTAMALTFLAIAVLVIDTRPTGRTRPSEWCALGAGLIASTALLGQMSATGPLYELAGNPLKGMAIHTALGILLISSGLLLERPDFGLTKLVTSMGPGGVLLRRLAPAAVAVPVGFAIVSIHLMNVPAEPRIELVFAGLTDFSTLAIFVLLAITAVRLNRAHETIERLQAETRELIDSASDGIYVADQSGRFIDVNSAGCRMLGYAHEEMLGMTVMDLIPPEDLPRLEQHRRMLAEGAVRINDWTLLRKDGILLPVEVSTKILPDGRWEAIIRDISDRKRAEREQLFLVDLGTTLPAALDVDEILSKIVDFCIRDLADFCVVELLEDGDRIRRARVACRDSKNAATCDTLSRVRSDYDRNSAWTLKRKGPILFETMAHGLGMSWGLNNEQARALQSAGFRSAIEIPLQARGKAIGRLLLITTGRHAFDSRDLPFAEALGTLAALSLDNKRLYRDAREAARARDEIIGYVAHDLRSPLHAIAINASGLYSGKVESIEAVGRDIKEAAQRMNRLIQDLLDITQIEAGQFSPKSARAPVPELIENILDSQRVLASTAGIEIRADVPSYVPDVLADRDRVLQVFENLIGNAIKFTKPGGSITLAAEPGISEVVLSVADTGPGIAERELPHVFDRFWQASKGKGHGTGLGLAIVKGIVEAHGGRVWVTSTPGKGSTFHFTIPSAPTSAPRETERAAMPRPTGDEASQIRKDLKPASGSS